MKKLLSTLFALTLLFGVSGCGSKEPKKEETNNTPTKEETKKEISFATVETMLKDNGYTVSETTPTAAQMIGATDGKKYHTDKGVIEVYQFDKAGEAYIKAEKEGIVTLDGFGDFAIVTNNGFGLFTDNVDENLISLFKAL